MSKRLELKGIIPSPPVVYTDATCRTVDYDAYAEHLHFLASHDISALCVGGHAGETECLTMEERLGVIRVAREVTKGSHSGHGRRRRGFNMGGRRTDPDSERRRR